MSGVDPMRLARDERADLAALLAGLSPEQWEAPTLCTRWRVRDVVAHIVSYDDLDARGLAARFLQGRFVPYRVNEVGLARYAAMSPDELLAEFRGHLEPAGLTAGFGGRVALVDGLIHHQDIRRPLGLPRDVPADRLAVALPFARTAPPIRAFWHARGLRLVATDVGWSSGRGPLVEGPAEALLMAMSGRAHAVADLRGPGRATLVRRLG